MRKRTEEQIVQGIKILIIVLLSIAVLLAAVFTFIMIYIFNIVMQLNFVLMNYGGY